ncbi:cyclic dof factor 5-like isoform X1 [Zingiber officinale]|uniref:Dof zinc finger protein n=1 Tax=Zingiber officinale TaxID=94328 RepID=A0A8J5GHI5_ZINOF|nr:cyclic dof factor 5-like isoform X1 [Zingiber officinale]KAG6507707.1 hypothetical protein ZIOFF_033058 [Zingiber officinale]
MMASSSSFSSSSASSSFCLGSLENICMDTNQSPQNMGMGLQVKPAGYKFAFPVTAATANSGCTRAQPAARPSKEQALKCPRCNSTSTKFCYYNNYSLSQPRYFCKTCRRYWTEGGSLRNVPVGGGSRKNKRSATSSSSSKGPKSFHEGQGLKQGLPDDGSTDYSRQEATCRAYTPGLGHEFIMPMPLPDYTLSFPFDCSNAGLGNLLGVQESSSAAGSSSKLLFPPEELRVVEAPSNYNKNEQFAKNINNKEGGGDDLPPAGFWNTLM